MVTAVYDETYMIRVYDKHYGFRGWCGGPNSLIVRPRHNVMGTATIELDAGHVRAQDLTTPGARVEIIKEDEKILTGPIGDWSIADMATGGTLALPVLGDFRVLHNTLAFPVADHTVGADGTINDQAVEYRTLTGPAETVVKTILGENLTRQGRTDITIAPDQGRGASGTYTFRMHPSFDRLLPAIEQAGIGVSVLQDGTNGLVLDVYEPTLYPHILSVENGTITEGSGQFFRPTATRVVVGGQGEGTARTFKQFIDTDLEAEWGDVVEVFQDARDSSSGDVYAERAAETLAESAPKTGFSLKLSETANFRYGGPNGVHAGDQVRVQVGALTQTEILREAELAWTPDDGDLDTPIVGERTNDPGRHLANQLRNLAKDNRDRKNR